MSGSGREPLPDVQEWSGGPSGCPGVFRRSSRVFGRPSRMSESGWETITGGQKYFPDVWEWSGGPPGCLEGIARPSRMSVSSR